MYSDWQAEAMRQIAKVHASMPDATPEQLRLALRKHALEFHGGTSWGKKTWSKRCREYLAKLTGVPKLSKAIQWPDDISFPFRDQDNSK